MITYVNKDNKGLYNTRFEQATIALRANQYISEDSDVSTLEEYFLYLRELADIAPYYTMLPVDEETFDIDANSRKIIIPESFAKNGIGVQGDEIAEIVYFTIDRFFDATDLSDKTMNIAIQWETANKIAGVSHEFIRDVESRPGKLIFGWPLSSEITNNPGIVKFSVRFYKIGERTVTADNGQEVLKEYLTYNFNTLTAEAKINGSLDYDLLHEKDTKLDIVNHNELILDRIVNSTITDPSIPIPGMPVWISNLIDEDIPELDAIYRDVLDMPEDTEDEKEIKKSALRRADAQADEFFASDAAKKYIVKDLTTLQEVAVDGISVPVNGHIMQAYAAGDGSISYMWHQVDVDAARVESSLSHTMSDNVNNAYFVPAEEGTVDTSRTYYIAQPDSNTGAIIGYKPYLITDSTLEIDENGAIDSNGTMIYLFEKRSLAIATKTGVYYVEATNRRKNKTNTIRSYKILIPMPYRPNIKTVTQPEGVVESNTGVEFAAVQDLEDDNVIHVLLNRDTNSTTLYTNATSPETDEDDERDESEWSTPNVALTYEWYRSDDDQSVADGIGIYTPNSQTGGNIDDMYKITGATGSTYGVEVSATNIDNFDKIYYAKVINNRNNATAIDFTKPYRVTAAPEKPVLLEPQGAPYGPEGNQIRLLQKLTDQSITLITGDIHSDEETYQWYKVNMDDEEEGETGLPKYDPEHDILLEGETNSTFGGYPNMQSGYYYCIMTNHLNGASNSEYTPFYNFVNP